MDNKIIKQTIQNNMTIGNFQMRRKLCLEELNKKNDLRIVNASHILSLQSEDYSETNDSNSSEKDHDKLNIVRLVDNGIIINDEGEPVENTEESVQYLKEEYSENIENNQLLEDSLSNIEDENVNNSTEAQTIGFLIVKITDTQNKAFNGSNVIVKKTYFHLSEKNEESLIQYAGIRSKENLVIINNIQHFDSPPNSWKAYKCQVLAEAETYELANNFLLSLKNKNSPNRKRRKTYNENVIRSLGIKRSSTLNNDDNIFKVEFPNLKKTGSVNTTDNNLLNSMKRMLNVHQEFMLRQLDKKFQDFNNSVEKKCNEIQRKMRELEVLIKDVRYMIYDKDSVPMQESTLLTFNEFMQIHNDHNFPLQTVSDFDNFNVALKENMDLSDNLKRYLISTINKNKSITDNMTKILKKFVSRDVLMKHTAQKKTGDKLIFSATPFYECLEEVIMKFLAPELDIEKRNVKKALGNVINNSIDWDGNRLKRMKHSSEEAEHTLE